VASVFSAPGDTVETDRWDGPLITLGSAADAAAFLRVHRLDEEAAAGVAATLNLPMTLTMRGCVVHGTSDPVIDVSGGRATAAAIPGAELIVIDGMGHNSPPGLWDELTSRIAELAKRTERAGARRTGT
jgi:pimeloyl-ACP methyl ester carboxylesterase